MTAVSPAARLQALLDLMHEVASTARPVDAVVSAWFRARRSIGDAERGDAERGEIITTLHVLLQHHARIGWWLERVTAEDTPRSRLLVWLSMAGRKPDQIAGLFNGANLAPEPLSRPERDLLRQLLDAAPEHADMPEAVRLECPGWAMAPLQRRFGDSFAAEMAAMQRPAPLDLRVNTLRTSRETMLNALQRLGHKAEALELVPQGIRLDGKLSLASLPMLVHGEVEIQDEGSQLVALLVGAQPGDRVVDFCAGAGGKTMAMATQMANKGHLIACDVSEGRLKRAVERFRKAGLHNIETRLLSSETDRWVKRHKAGFGRVLVDAPCSGTGTWRRNPDARWRAQADNGLAELVALQARILTSAARLVKPGGRLVYATCSLLLEENEEQVTAFLAAHPEFALVPLAQAAPWLKQAGEAQYLSLTPAQHGTDGFFAAVMERRTG